MSQSNFSALSHQAQGSSQRSAGAGIGGLLVAMFDRMADWSERRRQRLALEALPDHLLSDIGVSRADAEHEADKPFWRGRTLSGDADPIHRARHCWSGGCLCGGVRYEIDVRPEPVSFCHCGQCRRQHSHVGAYTGVPRTALRLVAEDTLAWYASSDRARRGFCARCGSGLFWDALDGGPRITVTVGSLDDPSGLHVDRHIFVDQKGGYYDIGADGVERRTSTGEVVE